MPISGFVVLWPIISRFCVLAGFDDELWARVNRLPARYTLDVNVERVEDVLRHKQLLQLAHNPANRPAFEIRLVQCEKLSNTRSEQAKEIIGEGHEPASKETNISTIEIFEVKYANFGSVETDYQNCHSLGGIIIGIGMVL